MSKIRNQGKMQGRQKGKRKPRNHQQKQNQTNKNFYYICGRNSVMDGLKSGNIEMVYVSENVRDHSKIQEIIDFAKEKKVRYETVTKSDLEVMIKKFANNQGVAALCKKTVEVSLAVFLDKTRDKENMCIVMLTEIEYEQNLGAILRTLDASGVDCVILSNRIKNTDSMVVRRISMGASESVNIFSQNIFTSARMLKEHGIRIVGIESSGDKVYINQDFSGRIAMVFGGEDKPLSQPVEDICDDILQIPMMGAVTSLNVSVSVGVIVYERLRQVIKKLQEKS